MVRRHERIPPHRQLSVLPAVVRPIELQLLPAALLQVVERRAAGHRRVLRRGDGVDDGEQLLPCRRGGGGRGEGEAGHLLLRLAHQLAQLHRPEGEQVDYGLAKCPLRSLR